MSKTRVSHFGAFEDIVREFVGKLILHPSLRNKSVKEIEYVIYSDAVYVYNEAVKQLFQGFLWSYPVPEKPHYPKERFLHIHGSALVNIQPYVEKIFVVSPCSLNSLFIDFVKKMNNRLRELEPYLIQIDRACIEAVFNKFGLSVAPLLSIPSYSETTSNQFASLFKLTDEIASKQYEKMIKELQLKNEALLETYLIRDKQFKEEISQLASREMKLEVLKLVPEPFYNPNDSSRGKEEIRQSVGMRCVIL
ncbi:MAG: hypothetical protein J0H68_01535 [Sphingobacteriia bacterium]|nr:hypothetical protein [Sphingobacteriia bacterium]